MIKNFWKKLCEVFVHDMRHVPTVYEKAVATALIVGVAAALFAENFPVTCLITAVLAAIFATLCYFTRHWEPRKK